jgi:hypothetical protein
MRATLFFRVRTSKNRGELTPSRIRALVVCAALVSILSLSLAFSGCTAAQGRRAIVSLNEVQAAAADTYDTAKAVETDAENRCRATLAANGAPLPATPAEIRPKCAAAGVQIPYDPVGLQKAAGPINALYDLIRAADAQRRTTGAAVPAEVLGRIAGLLAEVIADLDAAGVAVPDTLRAMPATLKGIP